MPGSYGRRPTGKMRQVRDVGPTKKRRKIGLLPIAESVSGEALAEVVLLFSRVLEHGRLDTLKAAHAIVGAHFIAVVDATPPGDLSNATEQRMLGMLWAEIEEEIDRRSKRKKK